MSSKIDDVKSNPHSRLEAPENVLEAAEKLRSNDEDLQAESVLLSVNHDVKIPEDILTFPPQPYRFVPLMMGGNGRTHVVSVESKRLIEDEVSLYDLEEMTTLFYEKAFADPTLDKFIRSHDDPHGSRFAKWIHQKLSGSSVWDQDRRARSKESVTLAKGIQHFVHDRSSAHAAAWYSPKRPSQEVGRHFELDECRVWMRLHFWALRESGIMEKSPTFADYYVRFIAHFVRVYESTAPTFARDSLRWSENPTNIEKYLKNGRCMADVLGITLPGALAMIPHNEVEDDLYPYQQYQQ